MFTKKIFRRFISNLIVLTIVLLPFVGFADVREITATGEYNMGESETLLVAKERVTYIAMQNAVEQAGVYLESYTQVINSSLAKDEIKMIASGIIEVSDKKFDRKISETGGDYVKVTITCKVNTDKVQSMMGKLQDKSQADTLRKIQADYASAMQEITALKQQLTQSPSAVEKKQVEAAIAQNEQKFTAVQWYEKGINTADTFYQISVFRKATELNPQYAEAYVKLAEAYKAQAQDELALEAINKAISLNPADGKALVTRGMVYSLLNRKDLAERDWQAGISLCRQTINTNPNDIDAYINLYLAYSIQGNKDLALSVSNEVVKANPQSAAAYRFRGSSYSFLPQYKRAIENYSQAIKLDPYYFMAYSDRGYAYKLDGKLEAAKQDFTKCIELDPQQVNSYFELAEIQVKLGQKEEAIHNYKLYLQYAHPSDPLIPRVKENIKNLGGML